MGQRWPTWVFCRTNSTPYLDGGPGERSIFAKRPDWNLRTLAWNREAKGMEPAKKKRNKVWFERAPLHYLLQWCRGLQGRDQKTAHPSHWLKGITGNGQRGKGLLHHMAGQFQFPPGR